MNRVIFGDCRDTMRDLIAQGVKVQMCVTSPPYFGLRDYGHAGQLGLEATPAEFVAAMVEVFGLVRELLADDGVLWLNLGDSYAGYHGNKNSEVPTSSTNGWTNGYNENKRGGARPQDIGLKPKDLVGAPWRVAFALQEAGWYLRQDIIWHKPNPMPESVTDRCTKAHEYLFLLTKSERYYFDAVAIQEDAQIWTGRAGTFDRSGNPVADHVIPGQSAAQHRPRVNERDRKALRTDVENRHRSSIPGGQSLQAEPNGKRNRRSVWTVPTQPYSGAHFAVFPAALIEPCILAGSRPGDVVLDPFMGSGTTAQVAQALGRQWIGCELNTEYAPLQQARTAQAALAI